MAPKRLTLTNLLLLLALLGRKGAQKHDAGVVDEDVRASELVMDPLGRGNQRVAVGDIRLDGDSAIAQLLSERIDPIHPPRQQRDP
jgi:hypothetical protein